MKTEKVTKDVFYSPMHDMVVSSDQHPKPSDTVLATLTYEVPREPLKAEFECDWETNAHGLIFPSVSEYDSKMKLQNFIGKKTRVTIQEVE